MNLTKTEILKLIKEWLTQWETYNLDGVMKLIHEEIIFENWTGSIVNGKKNLQKSWVPWFKNHGNFKFTEEDIFIDDQEQKVLFQWHLKWTSPDNKNIGKTEIRRGVDILFFKDGKIYNIYSYSKTSIEVKSVPLF
jgi:ketosteroid isomerase-like protein